MYISTEQIDLNKLIYMNHWSFVYYNIEQFSIYLKRSRLSLKNVSYYFRGRFPLKTFDIIWTPSPGLSELKPSYWLILKVISPRKKSYHYLKCNNSTIVTSMWCIRVWVWIGVYLVHVFLRLPSASGQSKIHLSPTTIDCHLWCDNIIKQLTVI